MYILLGKTEEELQVGKIELVIVHHGSVSFISEKYLFVKLSNIGVYCLLGPAQEQIRRDQQGCPGCSSRAPPKYLGILDDRPGEPWCAEQERPLLFEGK